MHPADVAAEQIRCPRCGAEPGVLCRTKGLKEVVYSWVRLDRRPLMHPARWFAGAEAAYRQSQMGRGDSP